MKPNVTEVDEFEGEKGRLESLRSAMDSAKDAVRARILINGGAAGGLLVFMGHLAAARDNQAIRDLAGTLIWFMVGLVVAILAHGTAYASHLNFFRAPRQRTWRGYRAITAVLIIASLGLFTKGGISASRAFFQTAKRPPPAPVLKVD